MGEENSLFIEQKNDLFKIKVVGDFDIHTLSKWREKLSSIPKYASLEIDLSATSRLDTAAALFLQDLQQSCTVTLVGVSPNLKHTLELVQKYPPSKFEKAQECSLLEKIGLFYYKKYVFFLHLLGFIGELFVKLVMLVRFPKYFRYKEILYEINQSAVRAIGIVALTSFLVGVVIAYQSAVQLKLYGANIFIVDMLGISILRELAPMITAIVIAGRSGSSYTAEIGAMKITEELDAMRTMGFDPYYYLVVPRIIALSVSLPILIFIADVAGVFGGMLVAHSQLGISFGLFIERFNDGVAAKHFFLGEIKGPFFAFLIATIAIYRGFMVKDDTQSIGKNTTKSVVESIFSVIVCDALFSVVFTNLGI